MRTTLVWAALVLVSCSGLAEQGEAGGGAADSGTGAGSATGGGTAGGGTAGGAADGGGSTGGGTAGGGTAGGGTAGGGTAGGAAGGGGVGGGGAPMRVTVQQGQSGYTGSRSVGISTLNGLGAPGQYNENGTTFGDGDNEWCTGTSLAGGYDEIWLLRFEQLPVPASATVVSATLTIYAHVDSPNVTLTGRYLNRPWRGDVTCAGCSAPVGWRYRDGVANPWDALGAAGEGTDVIAGKTIRFPETGFMTQGYTPVPITVQLDPSVVQGWVDGTANYGVRVVTALPAVHVSVVPPQRVGQDAMKPTLTIDYVP